MCNPALALGIASTVGGVYLQNQAQKKANKARGAAITANNQRNTALEGEAREALDTTLGSFDNNNFTSGQDAEAARLAAMFDAATDANVVSTTAQRGAPSLIQDTNQAELAAATAFGKDQNQKLADLNSFGSFLQSTISPQMNNSAAVGQMMGNFMKGNSSVLQSELEAANQKAYSPMAQLLMAGGQVGTNYGLYNG